MTEQLQLPIRTTTAGDHVADRLQELVTMLRGRGWVTRRQLEERGFDDRELRELVEHDSEGEILSFPGSPGYRLFDDASVTEIAATKSLRSQGRKMLRRFIRYQNRLHRPPSGRSGAG